MSPVSASYASDARDRAPAGPGVAFLWIALLINVAWFSAFAVSTASGILSSTPRAAALSGDVPVSAGGAQWALIEVIGAGLLALALAYAAFRYYTRDRSLDPAAEAAARDIYDNARRAREDD
jgi:hypothetical protein